MSSRWKFSLLAPLIGIITACGVEDAIGDLQDDAAALQAEYEGFNLSCDFDEMTGEAEVETDESLALAADDSENACEDAEENFAALVAEFDSDGDKSLSNEELAEAQAGWEDAQLTELDADGDGAVSAEEKKSWKADKLPGRKAKLDERFAAGCQALGKSTEECRGLRDVRKEKHKEDIKGRMAEFDIDESGDLNEQERQAMHQKLRLERDARRDGFKKKHDKDGDGKLSPEEHKAKKKMREDKKM